MLGQQLDNNIEGESGRMEDYGDYGTEDDEEEPVNEYDEPEDEEVDQEEEVPTPESFNSG